MKYKSIIRIEEPSTGLCNVGKETPIEDVGYCMGAVGGNRSEPFLRLCRLGQRFMHRYMAFRYDVSILDLICDKQICSDFYYDDSNFS